MSMPPAGRALRTVVLTGLMSLVAVSASRAQPQPDALHGFVSLSSDYVLNGLAQTYDRPSARVSVDFEHQSGFFAGGSLANVGYEAEEQFRTPRDTQINVYAGYVWRRDQWMTNLTLSRYRYPGIERRYDYTQATANVSFRERYFFAVSRASEYLSIYDNADVYRAGVALPWIGGLEVGVNAGHLKSSGFVDTSYDFWDVGLSRPIGSFALDLRYHHNTYEQSSLLGNYARHLWVLSASYAFLPIGKRSR
jgi:uncharacterized protein (TIGR02001 family)